MQNHFQKGKNSKSISNNQHYLCLFKTVRDLLQIRTLGLQMFPSMVKFFMRVYNMVTERHFGYLLCDLHPRTNAELRLRSFIFPGEDTVLYLSKS